MGETTNISWAAATYNPWQGCTKVSPGCQHCYMFRQKRAYGQDPGTVKRSADVTFYRPLKWTEPALVFTCSWSDFFHEAADEWRPEVWDIIKRTPHLTYQILTKRPERIPGCLPPDWGRGYPNVWLGVTVENEKYLYRLDYVLAVDAARHFVSCGPLLGPMYLEPWLSVDYQKAQMAAEWESVPPDSLIYRLLDWVIVEGESGGSPERALVEAHPRRTIDTATGHIGKPFQTWEPKQEALAWVRSIRDQCQAAGVPFHFKGWGGPKPTSGGRLLDGRTWDEMLEGNR